MAIEKWFLVEYLQSESAVHATKLTPAHKFRSGSWRIAVGLEGLPQTMVLTPRREYQWRQNL